MIHVPGAIDAHTRCPHYHGPNDIIAIKFRCCGVYYGCYECHQEQADHEAKVWPKREWNERAILCGSCRTELTVVQYMASGYRCPSCEADFNPGCRYHYHLYFESEKPTDASNN
ncbi:CHY zinc finger protein [Paenibacillus sp. TRM 82003]|nr:CHY zinc finger protein [Paenibacillus sp. TRM 82003]